MLEVELLNIDVTAQEIILSKNGKRERVTVTNVELLKKLKRAVSIEDTEKTEEILEQLGCITPSVDDRFDEFAEMCSNE